MNDASFIFINHFHIARYCEANESPRITMIYRQDNIIIYTCAPIKNITCYYFKILRINIRGAPVYIDVPRQCMCSKREGKKRVGDGSYGVTIYYYYYYYY